MEAQSITIAMTDRSAGFEATPDRVRLGDLANFSLNVATFLRGENKDVDTNTLEVKVSKGSLAIETAPFHLPSKLLSDLQSLLGTEKLLDSLDAKRREVLLLWQKMSRETKEVSFQISSSFLERSIQINVGTDYHADDADQWVLVERYVRGEIQDLGGVTKANAHIKLSDGSTLKVTAERAFLRDDTENRLYKPAMLRIKAQYNVLTRALRNATLVEFVDYDSTVDEDALSRMTSRGAVAWKDVPNATAWVDELRGERQ